MPRVAIVAALEREVKPLVSNWRHSDQQHQGRRFRFFEKDDKVLVCGGIGSDAARRAAEAVIALFSPEVIYSVGFAGGLDPALRVGDLLVPRAVIDARDSSRIETGEGQGVLVTFDSVADLQQKLNLHRAYSAQAVDMEASAVARAAEGHGIHFAAVKAISDEGDFALPSTDRFIAADGRFSVASFAVFAAVRPWTWASVIRLARNSGRASRSLCRWLQAHDGVPSTTGAEDSTSN